MRVLVALAVGAAALYFAFGRGPDEGACRGNVPVTASTLVPAGAVSLPPNVVQETMQRSMPGLMSMIDNSNGVAFAANTTAVLTFDSAGAPIETDEFLTGFNDSAGLSNVRDVRIAGGEGKVASNTQGQGVAAGVLSDCAGILVVGAREADVAALVGQLKAPAEH